MTKTIRSFHPGWKLFLPIILVILLVLFVLNASIPGQKVLGCGNGCALDRQRTEGAFRVVSLNMLHGFPSFKDLSLRIDLIAQEIRRLDADVVLLQEVPWTTKTGYVAETLARQLGYNYLYYRANGNKNLILFEEGEAILSRFPLSEAVTTELQPGADFFDTRVALGATVDTPWGKIRTFVTPLTNQDVRLAGGQAESLRKFVEANTTGLAVVAGDFNSEEDTPQITELSNLWTDAYRVSQPVEPGLTCCIDNLNAGPDEPVEKRIDYIFLVNWTGKSLRVQKVFDRPFQVNGGWQWASDHEGLMAEISP